MPITRSQMRRQLRRSGGIMDVTPRENFGLGSSLKKRIRKLIPNEVAKVATTVAPFVAPFNPAVAAAMAGIGGFDQTGSIGDSLKGAALTYGLGQGARFIGGAGFQGNPFTEGGAFRGGLEGFKSGFSSPLGTETGLGKMLSDNAAAKGKALKAEGVKPVKESTFFEDATQELLPGDTASAITKDTIIQNDPSIFELVKQGDYGDALMTGAKKFGKAMFTNKDGSLDKTAILAAASFGLTYLDALRIANEAGEDLPKEEYDEALKAEYKAKNDEYLKNFFGGKADGGRIGFDMGGDVSDRAQKYLEYVKEMESMGVEPISVEEFNKMLDGMKENMADGGRIGFAKGSIDNESEDIKKLKKLISGDIIENEKPDMSDMDDLMSDAGITFSRAEKSYLFRRLGGSGGADRSYTMPQLYRILNSPSSYPNDAAVLKEIAVIGLGGKKDGGRIGFESGANKQMAIENAMSELRKKYPELSEENLFNLVMNGFGGKSKDTEIPTPSIKIDNNIEDLPRGLQVDTTTSNPIPENAPNMAAAEIAKVIMGTLGDGEDMSSREFIFESYVKPKRKDLMENFGLNLQEADNLIREEMNNLKKPNMAMGGEVPVRKNQGGVMELDYRDTGGFVPIGIKERADDVPAMLSKNEFVMTADAVRGIGNGNVEKGAEKLYGVMKQAEKVGRA